METPKNKIEGFGGKFLHPSLDIKNDILILGFRVRATAEKEEEVFLIAKNGSIEVLHDTEFEHGGVQYVVELDKRKLAWLEERWGLAELNEFLDDYENLTRSLYPNPKQLFEEIVVTLKTFVKFEDEADYALVVAWIMGTYFHPIFPAYPFLNPKGPKGSGKSQLLAVLLLLAFNAVKARSSLAALGDIVDALRGTFLIDQADSLGRRGSEDLLDIITDSYKQSGGKRRIIEFDKNKGRRVTEFATYGPKGFASIRELPDDLRDRCIIIPIVRSTENFRDPAIDGARWKVLRGKLYRFLVDQYINVDSQYIELRHIYKNSETMVGRKLELWLPLETMFRCVDREDLVENAKRIFLSRYSFAEDVPSEFEEAVIAIIYQQFAAEAVEKITLDTKEIVVLMEDDFFGKDEATQQRAAKVGRAIKNYNLSSQKTRTGKGHSYLFHKKEVEHVYQTYIATSTPTQPTLSPDAQSTSLSDDVNVPVAGGETCSIDIHNGNPSSQTDTDKGQAAQGKVGIV